MARNLVRRWWVFLTLKVDFVRVAPNLNFKMITKTIDVMLYHMI